jgi:hypothetical protein
MIIRIHADVTPHTQIVQIDGEPRFMDDHMMEVTAWMGHPNIDGRVWKCWKFWVERKIPSQSGKR